MNADTARPDDRQLTHANLSFLREESLSTLAILACIAGYIWLEADVWPVIGGNTPMSAWVGAGLLLGIGLLSHHFRTRQLHFATHLLVWGLLVSTTFAAITFHSAPTIYLFLLPVIFASVLLSPRGIFAVTVASCAITLVVNFSGADAARDGFTPTAIIAIVAFAFWISARKLNTTLAWFSTAYEDAYRNEQIAREREGEMRRLFKALDDATFRLERLNYSLTLERNQAREAHRLKQQFAQTISHELRTPLNLIVAFTELMAQSPEFYGGSLPPAYVRDLSIVHRNAQHLQNLVNDVLDLARIEAAQMTVVPERTDVSTLVSEATNTARSLIEMRGLELHTEIEPNLPPLWVDPTRIRQVLFNLLSNAARFTDAGSITIRAYADEAQVLFSVTDTGIGIAREDMPRLFKDFQQLDSTTRRRHGGAGLGLAISRRFVELHKGRIWVDSEVGVGSTFTFSLPVTEPQAVSAPGKHHWKGYDEHAIQPGHHSILLAVTRNPGAVDMLLRQTHQFRTVIAHDLTQAKQMARHLLPQCVMIDAGMETITREKLQALSENWELPRTPFIACHLPGHEVMAQKLDVASYLTKPISIQRLRETLTQFGESVNRILVIDSDPDFVRLLSRMFEYRPRSQVISAYNARDGLALLRQTPPDLILLDNSLPDRSTSEVVTAIRATASGRSKPIVLLMAEDETVDTIPYPILLAQGNGLPLPYLTHLTQYLMDVASGSTASAELKAEAV